MKPPSERLPSLVASVVKPEIIPAQNLELAVVGRNLLDEEHPEFTTRSFYPSQVQRGVYGAVTWRY